MGKNAFFIGQPILSQLIKLVPKSIINQAVGKYDADRYVKSFRTYDHFITLLYSSLMGCQSLRELTTGLQLSSNRLRHLGLTYSPRRSTISDANKRRTHEVFGYIFHSLVKHYFPLLPDSRKSQSILSRLFIVDSTTITLFSNIMQGAGSYKLNGRKKGGVKAHVMLNAEEDLPVFVHITEGKQHDQVFMRYLPLKQGSFIVFDKAYTNSNILYQWDQDEVWWVTRKRNKSLIRSLTCLPISQDEATRGVLQDQLVQMGRRSNKTTKVMLVRLVTFYDFQSNRNFEFITNNFEISSLEVAQIYKRRWQIEIMFKRWKSTQPLRYFLGDNPNAIKIQIWIALIADLLIQVVRKSLKKSRKRWSFSNLASIIRQHLFTYVDLAAFLTKPELALLQNAQSDKPKNQGLTLFNSS